MPNRSRTASLCVLGLAATAFVVDRFMFGGPEAASAATGDELIPNESSGTAATRGSAFALVSRDTAAARLANLDSGEAGDLGAVPAWLKVEQAAAVQTAPGEDPVRAWEKKHEVSGYTRGAQVGVSVDGKFLRVGDEVDGMILKEVDSTAWVAVFENQSGARATLAIPRRREQGSENPGARK
jgi:hypothetical protein